MRRSLMIVAAAVAPVLALVGLPATANATVRASVASDALVTSVSCGPGGNCAAGGRYLDPSFGTHAFVLTKSKGQWGTAIEVPGLAALHPKNSSISSVSCAPGGCAAGGYYQGSALRYHAFVTTEKNGKWSPVTTVFSESKASDVTEITALSCSGPGNCTAGGNGRAFVVSEVSGRWGQVHEFPAADKFGQVKVSCTSAGNCLAGWSTFTASERNGSWGRPATLPGLSALGKRGAISSLSCPAAGSCAVGGTYGAAGRVQVFVASQRSGRWDKAIEIPGFTALNQEGGGELASVSCASAGNCEAGGSYAAPADFDGGVFEAFVATERNGSWGKAAEIPGIPAPSSSLCEPDTDNCVAGQVLSVSCAPAGSCAAGGWYDTTAIHGQVAFVATYQNGHWGKVAQIPGLEALDTATFSVVNSVSCPSAGDCDAGGRYSTVEQEIGPAFLVSENGGTWGQAQPVSIQG
jgi:hypothetical protein